MKTIVFGGSGFLGSHVADALSDAGHEVSLFDLQASPYLREDQTMILGDILDLEGVERAISGHDYVYNFAGLADIDDAKNRPLKTAQLNVMGNINILEASKNLGIKRFVFASSAYVFSKSGGFYRASKQASEKFIEAYQERYGLDFTILRYGSLYGRRADERNNIYRLVKGAMQSGKIAYKGTGEELREYIHVHDAAKLSVQVLQEEYANRHIILTGVEKMRVKDLMYMIKEMMDGKVELEFLEDRASAHYKITPYSFTPTVGHKLVATDHVDIGQGLLDTMSEISGVEDQEGWVND